MATLSQESWFTDEAGHPRSLDLLSLPILNDDSA
jgi:hypothetical protein